MRSTRSWLTGEFISLREVIGRRSGAASPCSLVREAHRRFSPHVSFLRSLADIVGQASLDELREDVDEVLGFLTHGLVPHAVLEERVLYPAVARAMGAPEATRTMSLDHLEVARLTERLRSLRPGLAGLELSVADARELRRILYGLHALLCPHVAKEEEVYLPLLEARLSAEEAGQLADEMAGFEGQRARGRPGRTT